MAFSEPDHHIYCIVCDHWIYSMESATPQSDKFSIMCPCGARNLFKDSTVPVDAILPLSQGGGRLSRTACSTTQSTVAQPLPGSGSMNTSSWVNLGRMHFGQANNLRTTNLGMPVSAMR